MGGRAVDSQRMNVRFDTRRWVTSGRRVGTIYKYVHKDGMVDPPYRTKKEKGMHHPNTNPSPKSSTWAPIHRAWIGMRRPAYEDAPDRSFEEEGKPHDAPRQRDTQGEFRTTKEQAEVSMHDISRNLESFRGDATVGLPCDGKVWIGRYETLQVEPRSQEATACYVSVSFHDNVHTMEPFPDGFMVAPSSRTNRCGVFFSNACRDGRCRTLAS